LRVGGVEKEEYSQEIASALFSRIGYLRWSETVVAGAVDK
jgi:hypothetical protein